MHLRKILMEEVLNASEMAQFSGSKSGRAVKKAGIKDLRFHDLRHEAVSRFFEMGMSVPEVALISGHKDVRQLFRYTHLNPTNVFKKYEAF